MKKSQPVLFPKPPAGAMPSESYLQRDPRDPYFDKATKTIHLYGCAWDAIFYHSRITIELFMFRFYDEPWVARLRKTGQIKACPKAEHFVMVVDMIWNRKDSPAKFDWHDFALLMAKESCENNFLAVAGAGGMGKSEFAAIYALVQAMCDPPKTLVIITSTSLAAAKKRVWGALKKYYSALPKGLFPFKLIESEGIIRYTGEGATDQMGITLVAADISRASEASSKLIGLHQHRVFLIADELAELADTVTKAIPNLSSNPYFQMIGLSNPKTRYDPMGLLAEPADGWDSINIETQSWKTRLGRAIRLDGKYSPNILAGEVLYPYLLTPAQWEFKIIQAGSAGEKSSGFLRMVRGWFPDAVDDEAIFNQADFDYNKAFGKAIWGLESPIILASVDSGYAEGGDRTILMFGKYGRDTDGKLVLEKTEHLPISDDASIKNIPPNHQKAKLIVDECKKRGVLPKHFGLDTTGHGELLAEIIITMWGPGIHRCQFGGAPSDKPMSPIDPTPANESTANRVSELWCCGADYLRAGHVKGICTDLAKELSSRQYDAAGNGRKRKVESKKIMKQRTGYSPDIADAWVVMIDLVRQRLRMTSSSKPGASVGKPGASWKKFAAKFSAPLTVASLRAE